MSMKSINHNKLHEVTNYLLGIPSNAPDPAVAVEFIESARDWYEGEIVRLRGLVKAAEGCAELGHWEEGGCPWCNTGINITPRHAEECPAFYANGELR